MYEYRLDDMYAELVEMKRLVRQLLTQAPVGFTAVTRGALRVASNEGLLVEGSAKVDGWLIVTGTERVDGRLEGSGTLDWTGPWFLRGLGTISGALDLTGPLSVLGTWDLSGNGQITGDVDITGALDVLNRLSLGPNGYIESGSVRIDRGGSYGGRIQSTGPVLALGATGSVQILASQLNAQSGYYTGDLTVLNDLEVNGSVSAQVKNFKIPHPTKACHVLRHGSTESPVSGVEYWGEGVLDDEGRFEVALPDYFEALTKRENRAVLVTARGFVADWNDIDNGAFTVTGKSGGRFSWLVKAERAGAEFLEEEALPATGSEEK